MKEQADDVRCVRVTFGKERKKKIYFVPQKTQSDLQSLKESFINSSYDDPNLKSLLAGSIDVVFSYFDSTFDDTCELSIFDAIDSKTTYSAVFVYHRSVDINELGMHTNSPNIQCQDAKLPEKHVGNNVENGHGDFKLAKKLTNDSMHKPPVKGSHPYSMSNESILVEDDKKYAAYSSGDEISLVEVVESECESAIKNLERESNPKGEMPSSSAEEVPVLHTKTNINTKESISTKKPILYYPCQLPEFSPKMKQALRRRDTALANYTSFVRECKNCYEKITKGKGTQADHKIFVKTVLDKYDMFQDSTNKLKPYVSMHTRKINGCIQ